MRDTGSLDENRGGTVPPHFEFMPEIPSDIALILVDHGSRSEASTASLEDVVREVADLAGARFRAVLGAHMELASPSLGDAFDRAVAAGAGFVVIALYFLAPGRHSEIDVPRLAAEAAARHPGVGYCVTSSLGPHRSISELVLVQADAALARSKK